MDEPRLRRLFLGWIVFALAAHGLACVAMVTVLGPGVSMHSAASARAAYVAASPWLWRLGWLPWHACALSNVGIGVVLARLAWRRAGRRGALAAFAALACTAVAVVPDQWGELILDTRVVDLARDVVSAVSAASVSAATGSASASAADALRRYVSLESRDLLLTGTCATAGYTAMLVCWLVVAVRLAPASRARSLLLVSGGVATIAFAASGWANVAPCQRATVEGGYPGFDLVVQLNTVGFAILVPWYALLGFVVAGASVPAGSAPWTPERS